LDEYLFWITFVDMNVIKNLLKVIVKNYLMVWFVLIFISNSCSYNPSVFDTTQQGEIMPDTIRYEKVYLKNSSGNELFGCMFKPAGEIRGTVFLLSSNSGDVALWYDVTSVMLKSGFQVLSFDYRGIGKSEGGPDYKGALEDSQLYLDLLTARDSAMATDIIFWGFGLGADIAIKLAFDNPGTADYIVLDSPYTSKRAITTYISPWFLKPFVFPFVNSGFSTKKLLRQINNTPILVIHSAEDQVVPFKMGERLYETANQPKLFFEALGSHGYSLNDFEDLYMDRIEKLLTY
jgi:fermentation-respiration switch protein FrsA (DUF1100 family)